jgi:hypothetical protein
MHEENKLGLVFGFTVSLSTMEAQNLGWESGLDPIVKNAIRVHG